ncbi:MAG: response regulator, partial [Pyrinomonadaceae bacterium]
MKKVLIVDDEKLFLSSLSEGLQSYSKNFQTLTAENGKQAIEILEREEVDLVVTDLRMPEIDGFKLISYLSKNFPNLPIITITAFGTPEIESQLKNYTTAYIEKPIDFQKFADQIISTLEQTTVGNVRGISLPSFLQLIEIERKSCTVVVESEGRMGVMYFIEGRFVGAEFENLTNEAAAYEMLSWDDVKIDVGKPIRKLDNQVSIKITDLLLKAAKFIDESKNQPATEKKSESTEKAIFLDLETKQGQVETLTTRSKIS